jgi:hypothetical protein
MENLPTKRNKGLFKVIAIKYPWEWVWTGEEEHKVGLNLAM